MKKITALEMVFVPIALFIVVSEGLTLNALTLWNLVPVIVCYFLLKNGLPFWKSVVVKITLFLTGIALILFPLVTHLIWATDFIGMKAGSSTSALIFTFIPFWALLFAFIPAIIQLAHISKLKNRSPKP